MLHKKRLNQRGVVRGQRTTPLCLFMNTKKTIYIFGNPLLHFDSLPIQLTPELAKTFPDFNFVIRDPNENLHPENGELIIIDTIMGIDKITIIDDINQIDKIESSPAYSLHDFDLGFNLKLLKKIGELKKVIIIGVPSDIDKNEALKQIIDKIKEIA